MNFKLKFEPNDRKILMNFGAVQTALDGGYERGYEEGYADGLAASGGNEFHDFLAGELENVDFGGITELRNYTFYYANGIKNVRLSNVEKIGTSNFYNCPDLEAVDLPSLTGTTNTYFCAGSRKLTTVNIPKVTILGKFAFQNAAALQTIDLPSVDAIDTNVFGYCNKLQTVILRKDDGVVTLAGGNAVLSRANIYVPDALVEQYKVAAVWSTYASQIKPLSELKEG